MSSVFQKMLIIDYSGSGVIGHPVRVHTGWPKKEAAATNRIKSQSLLMRLDFFVKLKCQLLTIILSVRIKYYVREILCDVLNNA